MCVLQKYRKQQHIWSEIYNFFLLFFIYVAAHVAVLHLSRVTPRRTRNLKNCGSAHRNLLRLSHSSAVSTDHAVSHFASRQTLQAKVLTPSHTNAPEHIRSPSLRGETLWKTISLTPLCTSSCAAKKFAQFPSSGAVMMWVEVGRSHGIDLANACLDAYVWNSKHQGGFQHLLPWNWKYQKKILLFLLLFLHHKILAACLHRYSWRQKSSYTISVSQKCTDFDCGELAAVY